MKLLSLQILAPVAALLGAATTAAQTLDGIQLRASQHRSDIVLVTTGSPEPRLFELDSPARVVLDLVGASKNLEVSSQDLAEGPVERVRIGQFVDSPAPITRIVADLRRSCRYELARVEGGFALVVRDGRAVAAVEPEESLPVQPRSPATPPPLDEAEGPESLVDDVAERQTPAPEAPVASWAPGGAVLEVDERAEFTASANGALQQMSWAVHWEPPSVLGGLTTYADGARTVVTIHARQSGVGRLWVTGDGRELAEAKLYVLPPPPSKSLPVALTTLAVGALAGALAARENDESDLRIWLGYGALPMLALSSGIAWWRYRDQEAARRKFLTRPPEPEREAPLVSATKRRAGG